LRPPLSGPSVNLAGKPSRVGGAVASMVGWLVLLLGGSLALGVALLFAALEAAMVGVALAAPIAIVALVVGIVLVRRGSALRRSGAIAERETREQALLAVAAHRGEVTAGEAARALGIGIAEADAMLTELAKREPERVAVDVDDQGIVRYRPASVAGDVRVRVADGMRVSAAEGVSPEDEMAAGLEKGKEKEAGA
jgi:hypothetical protein